MSLETEIKKLAASVVQLTDAAVQLKEAYLAMHVGGSQAPTIKPAETTVEQKGKFDNIVSTFDPPVEEKPDATDPGTFPQQEEPVAEAPQMTYADLNAILGEVADKMGDNGAGVRGLLGCYGATYTGQIPQADLADCAAKARALVGG